MRVRLFSSRKTGMARVVLIAFLLAGLVALIAGCGTTATTTTSASTPESSGTTAGQTTATSGATTGEDQEVTLSMVCFLDKSHIIAQTLYDWIAAVETATNGTVKINWKGGPEVIPPLEQIEAVRGGIVDINANVSAYYGQLNPVLRAMALSSFTPAEERENGIFDYIHKQHEAIDTVYVGRWMGELPFYVFLNKQISSPADFKGMSLRSRAAYDSFFKALGVSVVSVDTAETYTALERGIVQGFGWPLIGAADLNWDTKAPFCLDHGFWPANNACILFNPQSWSNKLSDNQRNAILKATAEYEMGKMVPYFLDVQAKERGILEGRGMTFFKFSDADAKAFLDLADQVEWDALKADSPDKFDEVRKLFGLSS